MRIIDKIRANPGAPITTADGLREAIWDLITDELPADGITMRALSTRLPYGSRLRHIVGEFVGEGLLIRTGWGVYSLP